MFVEYVVRGVKAGVVAGLVFGLFVALVVNPMVGYAEAVGHDAAADDHAGAEAGGHEHEEAGAHEHGAAGDGAGPPGLTDVVSVAAGVLWAVLLGAVVFGAGFYLLEPVLPGTGGTRSYALAAAGFVAVSGAPWLAVPPRPPGVGGSPPQALYAGAMVAGAVAVVLAMVAYDRLRPRGRAVAGVAAALAFAPLAVPVALAPSAPAEGALPPELAAGVTGLIVFGQALLWLLLGAVHARLHGRRGRRVSETDGPAVAAD